LEKRPRQSVKISMTGRGPWETAAFSYAIHNKFPISTFCAQGYIAHLYWISHGQVNLNRHWTKEFYFVFYSPKA
jgi:hypothetical protein